MELCSRVLAGIVAMALLGMVAVAQGQAPDPEPLPAPQSETHPETVPVTAPPPVAPAVPYQPGEHDPRGIEELPLNRYSIGLGAGLVDTGVSTEPYFAAALRMRFGQRGRDHGPIGAYLEPEVGYWKRDAVGVSEQDTMVGVNLGGVVTLRAMSYFVAAGVGLHFVEIDRLGIEDDGTSLGVNVQVGVDVHLTPSISMLGVGRVDLVEKLDDRTQAKVYLGLRGHF